MSTSLVYFRPRSFAASRANHDRRCFALLLLRGGGICDRRGAARPVQPSPERSGSWSTLQKPQHQGVGLLRQFGMWVLHQHKVVNPLLLIRLQPPRDAEIISRGTSAGLRMASDGDGEMQFYDVEVLPSEEIR